MATTRRGPAERRKRDEEHVGGLVLAGWKRCDGRVADWVGEEEENATTAGGTADREEDEVRE